MEEVKPVVMGKKTLCIGKKIFIDFLENLEYRGSDVRNKHIFNSITLSKTQENV